MATEIIPKETGSNKVLVAPNMESYEELRRSFNWHSVASELHGLPDGGLNLAYEAVDRHAESGRSDHIALRWLGENGETREFTYAHLKEQTDRFANVLRGLEIEKGDVVCTLTGRIPELYISALGTLKNGSIYCPLFSIYGPEPIYQRMTKSKAKVLITTEKLFEEKIEGLLDRLEHLEYILL
ncbi:MAG TPA: AMP-binding protein, partial [Halalkalibaculum sp.]|nr:AMP-binding protein [Halalkalibaculum sp.]